MLKERSRDQGRTLDRDVREEVTQRRNGAWTARVIGDSVLGRRQLE
ncbi:MAG: hypothetical protein AB7I34_14245 [Rhizobiaceae bacterium]